MQSDYSHIALILLVVIVFLLAFLALTLLTLSRSRPIVTCSYLSFSEAQKTLSTHPGLDRDHDGVACERNGS